MEKLIWVGNVLEQMDSTSFHGNETNQSLKN